MTTYAGRALPWGLLAVCAGLVACCLAAVAWKPYQLWPLQGIAVGVVAAAGAWCVDEPAGELVDTVPRALWWRTVVRGLGVVLVIGAWVAGVAVVRGTLFGHALDVAVQGVVAALAGFAFGTWRRRQGAATPGSAIGTVLVPAVALWALTQPAPEVLPVFPYTAAGPWGASQVLWLTALGTAVIRLCLDLSERRPARACP